MISLSEIGHTKLVMNDTISDRDTFAHLILITIHMWSYKLVINIHGKSYSYKIYYFL